MWRGEDSAPTRSILRVASTQSTRNTSSKRVTFADELLNIMYTPPRRPRPAPPSTVPPLIPNSPAPGRLAKNTPRNTRAAKLTPRDVPRSARRDNLPEDSPRYKPEIPSRRRLDTSPRRYESSRRRAEESPRGRNNNPRRPRVENPSRNRADIPSRASFENGMQVLSSVTTSGRSSSSHRHHNHHHRHSCSHHRCRRRERRERRRLERENALPSNKSGTDVSVMGSDAAPSQRADRVARERRIYDNGVVKRRTNPERRRESLARATVNPEPRFADMRTNAPVTQQSEEGERLRRTSVRRVRNDPDQRFVETPKASERVRSPARPQRRARNSEEKPIDTSLQQSGAVPGSRRRRSERGQKERVKREERKPRGDFARREARVKALRANSALAKARRFVARSLALTRDGYPADMLDLIEARTIFKLYLRCRERTRKGDDLLMESGQRLEEAQLRKKMMEEEAELKNLEKDFSASELSDPSSISSDRKVTKKKKSGLQHFVADELGSSLSSMRGISRGQLDRAVLAAAIARADRFETYRYDGASYY